MIRAEHVVLAVASVSLLVLVVLPLVFLLVGSLNADGQVTIAHFRDG